MPVITALYAAPIAILFAVLSTAVATGRGLQNAPSGSGDAALALSIRRFGNLAEYGAMALLVLLLLEMTGHDPFWLHLYGGLLVAFRLLHPLVLFADPSAALWRMAGRFIAAAGTAALLLVGGGALAWSALIAP